MGYEKFVKNIFPFIGNQYTNVEENNDKSYQIVVTLDELKNAYSLSNTGAIIDFKKNRLVWQNEVKEQTDVLNKLMIMLSGTPEDLDDVALALPISLDPYLIYMAEDLELESESISVLFDKDTPYTFYNIEKPGDTIQVTNELLGVESIKITGLGTDGTDGFVISYKASGGNPEPAPQPEPEPEPEPEVEEE